MSTSVKRVFDFFPKLTKQLKKGECGRIMVIGGAAEYTGAPYFAAMAPMKIGADLLYVYTHREAAPVIKSYSPELIVHPTYEFSEIQRALPRVDSLVIGPGWGRDPSLTPLLRQILNEVQKLKDLCVDGLFHVMQCLDVLSGLYNVILTPNYREFDRLYEHVFPSASTTEDGHIERVHQLASTLKVNVLCKGVDDVITDGSKVEIGSEEGCPRRCGGQGDLLSGAIALFIYWARLKDGKLPLNQIHVVEGAHAASDFIRMCARDTFSKVGRSLNTSDILAHIGEFIRVNDAS